jgi:hypothetical protein
MIGTKWVRPGVRTSGLQSRAGIFLVRAADKLIGNDRVELETNDPPWDRDPLSTYPALGRSPCVHLTINRSARRRKRPSRSARGHRSGGCKIGVGASTRRMLPNPPRLDAGPDPCGRVCALLAPNTASPYRHTEADRDVCVISSSCASSCVWVWCVWWWVWRCRWCRWETR